tara:strand:- start:5739 stop:6284 length:546 start_codon:yes stop_codon:yes gene_type:complete
MNKLLERYEFTELLEKSDKLWKKELKQSKEDWVKETIKLYNENNLSNHRKLLFYEVHQDKVTDTLIKDMGELSIFKELVDDIVIKKTDKKRFELINRLKLLLKIIKKDRKVYNYYNPPEIPQNQLGYYSYDYEEGDVPEFEKKRETDSERFKKVKDKKYMDSKDSKTKDLSIDINLVKKLK